MTSTDHLQAGRELDAAVAQKVFGWTVELIVGPNGSLEEWRDSDGRFCDLSRTPFSTSIEAAWTVVEHFAARGRFLWIAHQARGPLTKSMEWAARFAAPQQFEGRAETAPLAICRAALSAASDPTS